MKKHIFSAAVGLFLMSGTAQAQQIYQLQNADFEQWESVGGGEEPLEWNSFLTATGSMAGMVKAVQLTKTDDAHHGQAAARITARNVMFGIIAQGNMTTGCINAGSMSAADASGNYNYTRTEQPGQAMAFTGIPDSLRVWIKSNTAGPAKVSAYLHDDGYYQDPNTANTDKFTMLNASAQATPQSTGGEWQCITIPFQYQSDFFKRPAYALVSFATSSTPGGGKASDWMIVDDIQFIYCSTLRNVVANGQAVRFDENGEATVQGEYDPDNLSYKVVGEGAGVESLYNGIDNTLTITVTGDNVSDDPTNVHAYVLHFTGGEQPDISYPLSFPADQVRENPNRTLHTLSLSTESAEKQFSIDADRVYNDLSSQTFSARPGETLTLTSDYADTEAVHDMIWMHAYTYIDLDSDGQFQVSADPDAHTATGDLQAWSFYSFNPADDSEGWDSNGQHYTGDARTRNQCPELKLPTQPGDYRLRYKIDWNSIDPAGDLEQGIVKNGGYIVDINLHILSSEEDPTLLYTLNFPRNQAVTHATRRLNAITLTADNGEERTWATDPTLVYNDLTDEIYEVQSGSRINLTADFTDEAAYDGRVWMNTYVFMDKEQDGQFQVSADPESLTVKGDILAWSFYSFNPDDDSQGWDSADNYYTDLDRANLQCPDFQVSGEPGDYRLRVKIDWNSIDPAGDQVQGIVKNGGYIVDLTLRIPVPEGIGPTAAPSPSAAPACDLQGRRIQTSAPARGIILQNGRKVVK